MSDTVSQVASALENDSLGAEVDPSVAETETPNNAGDSSANESSSTSDFAEGILKDIPEIERPIVEKYMRQWDQQVQQRFQSVHSEYEGWKPFRDNGVDPQEVSQLLALGEALNASPQETIAAIIEAYGLQQAFQAQQTQETQQQGYGANGAATQNQTFQNQSQQPTLQQQQQFAQLPEEVQQRLAMVDTMAQIMLEQQQQVEAAAADRELEQTLASLREKYGEFDNRYVLTMALQSGDLEGSVREYQGMVDSIKQQAIATSASASAPTVIGSGGGLPGNDFDPTKLSSKDTKNLVAQMLNAQAK